LRNILGRESKDLVKHGDKLGEQLKKSRYVVEKLQREMEDLRDEWNVTISYQKTEQLEPLQRQIAEAEEE